MNRPVKRDLLNIFLPVEMVPEVDEVKSSSFHRLWSQFQPELIEINRRLRDCLGPIVEKLLDQKGLHSLEAIAKSKNILTTKEVAVLVGKSEGSIRNFVCDGRLKPISKKWNTNYFNKEEVIKTILSSDEGGDNGNS